jgi:Dolichyl-phosphate-mannose-protein mannosyltransferase
VSRARYARVLSAILGAGALLRLFIVVWIPTQPVSDFYGFLRVAQNLAATGRYEAKTGLPDGGRSPAYPVLLSLAFRLDPAGDDVFVAKLTNLLLAVLAGLAGATLARRLWGDAAGLWTAALIAFLPRALLMADLLAAENLLAPLWLLFLLLCATSWTGNLRLGLAAGIGIVAGLLCLTRAVLYLAPVVWLVGAVSARRPWRAIARDLLVILAVEHAVLLPWAVRNRAALGRFTPFNLIGGVGLFISNNPQATGEWYPWPGQLERLRPGTLARGAAAVDDAAREEALRWILAHPGRAAGLYFRKLRIIAADDGFAATFTVFAEAIPAPVELKPVLRGAHPLKEHPGLVHGVLRVSGLLLAAAGLGGFVLLCRGARMGSLVDRALAAEFAAAALYVPLLSAAMAVNGRYRWAAEDAIMPLAGLFLSHISTSLKTTSSGRGPLRGRPPSAGA